MAIVTNGKNWCPFKSGPIFSAFLHPVPRSSIYPYFGPVINRSVYPDYWTQHAHMSASRNVVYSCSFSCSLLVHRIQLGYVFMSFLYSKCVILFTSPCWFWRAPNELFLKKGVPHQFSSVCVDTFCSYDLPSGT